MSQSFEGYCSRFENQSVRGHEVLQLGKPTYERVTDYSLPCRSGEPQKRSWWQLKDLSIRPDIQGRSVQGDDSEAKIQDRRRHRGGRVAGGSMPSPTLPHHPMSPSWMVARGRSSSPPSSPTRSHCPLQLWMYQSPITTHPPCQGLPSGSDTPTQNSSASCGPKNWHSCIEGRALLQYRMITIHGGGLSTCDALPRCTVW